MYGDFGGKIVIYSKTHISPSGHIIGPLKAKKGESKKKEGLDKRWFCLISKAFSLGGGGSRAVLFTVKDGLD